MYSFPELIQRIRMEASLTQAQFAKEMGVSTVLIAMVESGQKEVSKNLLCKIAKRLDVHPSSITPFLYGQHEDAPNLSALEKQFIMWGEKLQNYLIKDKAKLLKQNAKETLP